MSAVIDLARYQVTDGPLPNFLVLREVAQLLRIGNTRAWQLERAGELARFELLPRLGNKARYSGEKLREWLQGQGQAAESSRFFGAGRQRRQAGNRA